MVYKPFKPSIRLPNYIDDLFLDYLNFNHISRDGFEEYKVVPKKNVEYAEKSLLRYSQACGPYSDQYVQYLYLQSIEKLDVLMHKFIGPSEMYDFDQVVSNLQPLRACGYPWMLQYQYKIDYWTAPVKEFFDIYWLYLPTVDYIKTLCNVSLKEELRLASKILAGKVRSIIAMDVNHIVAHCILAMDQNERMMTHLFETPFMLGLNLFYGGADRLVRHMTPPEWKGPCSIELDGKQFDGTCKHDPHFKGIAELRWRWLHPRYRTKENKKRLQNLYRDLCYSPLINIDGHVFGRSTGNPSGQGCTTPDNSFKNWMDIYVLWCLCTPEHMHGLECFIENVKIIIVGDDVTLSVNPEVHEYFNPVSIEKNSHKIGMEYHFASMEFQYFQNTTFLGHGFLEVDDHPRGGLKMYYPTIDSVKMRCSLLQYNEEGTIVMSIIRACALRNETFANKLDRAFFNDYLLWLKDRYFTDADHEIKSAWKAYLTDNQLHELYSGFSTTGYFSESTKQCRFDGVFVTDKDTQTIIQEIDGISADHLPVVLIETC